MSMHYLNDVSSMIILVSHHQQTQYTTILPRTTMSLNLPPYHRAHIIVITLTISAKRTILPNTVHTIKLSLPPLVIDTTSIWTTAAPTHLPCTIITRITPSTQPRLASTNYSPPHTTHFTTIPATPQTTTTTEHLTKHPTPHMTTTTPTMTTTMDSIGLPLRYVDCWLLFVYFFSNLYHEYILSCFVPSNAFYFVCLLLH
mmetsp:Transcript_10348/g.12146  ORF Transcript_10348/g.12146 Transcript_10348/m.12146 type:complete len:200 (-) Transcript_10348:68-667(-)